MSKRYIIVLPFAAIATAGLFGLMTALIRTEWSPQTKSEVLKYEINPQVIDITFPRPDLRPNEIKRIETPPAPPIIDVQKAIQPVEPIATLKGAIPEFKFNKMDITRNIAINVDSEEKPIIRNPPKMPMRAERSGHCQAEFDINAQGVPFNITTPYCTQSIFSRPTIKAVETWKYRAAVQDGTARTSRSIRTKVSFNLNDENGRLIPE